MRGQQERRRYAAHPLPPLAGDFAMLNETKYYCPECDEGFDLPKMKSRREFLRAIGATAAAAAVSTSALTTPMRARGAEAAEKPAESLIKELYATLSAEQKAELVLPYDHDSKG